MAETIRELLIRIGLDSNAALTGLKKIEGSLSSVKSMAKIAVGVVAAVGGSLIGMAISAERTSAELVKQSEMLGVTTQEYQRLSEAAKLARVDGEAFSMGMRFFGQVTGAAILGNKEAMKSFRQLGVTSLRDVNGHIKTQTELLMEVTDHLHNINSIQIKLRLMRELFGRGSYGMLPFFNQGTQGIKEMMTLWDTFGYTLSDKDVKAGKEFNITLKLMDMYFGGLKNKIGFAVLPMLNNLGFSLLQLIALHKKFGTVTVEELDKVDSKYRKTVKELEAIRDTFQVLGDIISKAVGWLDKFYSKSGKLADNTIVKWLFPWIKDVNLDDYIKTMQAAHASLTASPSKTTSATGAIAGKGNAVINIAPNITIMGELGAAADKVKAAFGSMIDDQIRNLNSANHLWQGTQ